eukprot:TRINITY_DN14130_c0_g1_i1.p2 TRINITY_DN14130_c0_g1~~TRINITY_DN14130_c0_g1_i1.p2  ORF type:complete len:206 (+),score=1.40 TRINITY_DN14130_c0_g1_i1:456-1073(+)
MGRLPLHQRPRLWAVRCPRPPPRCPGGVRPLRRPRGAASSQRRRGDPLTGVPTHPRGPVPCAPRRRLGIRPPHAGALGPPRGVGRRILPLGGVHRVGGYGYGAPYVYGGGSGIRASGYDSAGYGPIGGAMPVSYSAAQFDHGGAYPPARSLYGGADPYLAGGSPGRYARGSGYGYGAGYGGSGIGQRAYGYGGRGAAGGCSSCSM